MSFRNAVRVTNLTKTYRIYGSSAKRALAAFGIPVVHKEFKALQNVSIDFPEGEVTAILGRNGSGKSTLLKIITGVVQPTSGSVEVDGRISAMLELTSGFDRELTGRENVYLKALTRGLRESEIAEKVSDIVAFADIGEHIDQPVRTYSSGMKSRLGFAVAVNVDPDILIIDEALAVGDDVFKMKCIDRMSKFRAEGKTILFVSHSLSTVRGFCTRGVWINEGKVMAQGDLGPVVAEYENYLKAERARVQEQMLAKAARSEQRAATRKDIFSGHNFTFLDAENKQPLALPYGQPLRMRFTYNVKLDTSPLYLALNIADAGGHAVFTMDQQCYELNRELGQHEVILEFPELPLLPGDYYVSGQIWENETSLRAPFATNKRFSVISDTYRGAGTTYLEHRVTLDGSPLEAVTCPVGQPDMRADIVGED